MQVTNRDRDRITEQCARAAMVLISRELDQLLASPDLRCWCSDATIALLVSTQEAVAQGLLTRSVVMFAREVSERASAMTWPISGIGEIHA